MSGETHFWQKKSDEDLKPVRLDSKWRGVTSNDDFSLSILDSDLNDCLSETVLYDLRKMGGKKDQTNEGATVFDSNKRGKAVMRGKIDEITLKGTDSIIGKWL